MTQNEVLALAGRRREGESSPARECGRAAERNGYRESDLALFLPL